MIFRNEPIQFISIPNDKFVLNTLEIVEPDELLYRILRNEGFERIIMFKHTTTNDEFLAYSFDSFSIVSFINNKKFLEIETINEESKNNFVNECTHATSTNKKQLDFTSNFSTSEQPRKETNDNTAERKQTELNGLYPKNLDDSKKSRKVNVRTHDIISFYQTDVLNALKQSKCRTAIVLPEDFINEKVFGKSGNLAFEKYFEHSNKKSIYDNGNLLLFNIGKKNIKNCLYQQYVGTDISQENSASNTEPKLIFKDVLKDFDETHNSMDLIDYLSNPNQMGVYHNFDTGIKTDEVSNLILREKCINNNPKFAELNITKIYPLARKITEYFNDENDSTFYGILGKTISESRISSINRLFAQSNSNNDVVSSLVTFSESLISENVKDMALGAYDIERITDKHISRVEGSEKAVIEQFNKLQGMENVKNSILGRINYFIDEIKYYNTTKNLDDYPFMNMMFVGAPGTGKTTVGKLVAKLMYAKGLLATNNFKIVDASELMSEYVNQTARNIREVAESAVGGVLMIDEFYEFNNAHSNGNTAEEAVNALVSVVNRHKNDLCIIICGYEEQVRKVLSFNKGAESRFPNIVKFNSYSIDVLYDIFKDCISKRGRGITPEGEALIKKIIEVEKDIQGEDFGNARYINSSLIPELQSACNDKDKDYNTYTKEDVLNAFPEKINFLEGSDTENQLKIIEEKFNKLTGIEMQNVKKQIFEIADFLKDKIDNCEELDELPYMNMQFLGSPGTGKTTVGKLVAQLLFAKGILKTSKFKCIDASSLTSKYLNETGEKLRDAAQEVIGGVLMIDEFYGFSNGDGSGTTATEAMNALLSIVNEHKNNLCIIICGYENKIKKVFSNNEGGQRRFPHRVEFTDYSVETLMEIFDNNVKKLRKGMMIDSVARNLVEKIVEIDKDVLGAEFGNAGYINDILLAKIDAKYISHKRNDKTYTKEDVLEAFPEKRNYLEGSDSNNQLKIIEEKFNRLTGKEMQKVKNEIYDCVNLFESELRNFDDSVDDDLPYMNMIFVGGPGTGKTTVGKLVAQLLYARGILKTNNFVKVDANELTAKYVNETAENIREAAKEAIGGVFMIDEFYAFNNPYSSGNTANEAMNALLSVINTYRNKICVIICGYKEEVYDVLKRNKGGLRRFPNEITFEDYSVETLLEIFKSTTERKNIYVDDKTINALKLVIEREKSVLGDGFGNAGYIVDNLLPSLKKTHYRYSQDNNITFDDVLNTYPDILKGHNNSPVKEEDTTPYIVDSNVLLNREKEFEKNKIERLYIDISENNASVGFDINSVISCIYRVNAFDSSEDGNRGTAFSVGANGYLLTCYHVIENSEGEICRNIYVTNGEMGKRYKCNPITYRDDSNLDLAVLKIIDESLTIPTLRIANEEYVAKERDEVFISGYPVDGISNDDNASRQSIETAVSDSKETLDSKTQIPVRHLQAHVHSGCSGSPVISKENGLVIGWVPGELAQISKESINGSIAFFRPIKLFIKDFLK